MTASEVKFYSASSEVLALSTNERMLKWSWGTHMPEISAIEFEEARLGVSLVVDDDRSRRYEKDGADGKYHYFAGAPGRDAITYERPLLGRSMLRARLEGLECGTPTLTVNRNYMKYVTHRFMNLHSAGYILTDAVALSLLRRKLCPLHCSAFRYNGKTVLVLAPPNTGKTLTAMTAVSDFGAEFIAEDLAITDGISLFSVPWTSTFRYYGEVDSSWRSRALNTATSHIPLLELLPLGKQARIDDLIPPDKILGRSLITHVVVLQRGAEEIVTAGHEEMSQKALNLNRYEFNYLKSPSLVAYEFFNPGLDLDSALKEEKLLIDTAIDNAEECLMVTAGEATRYAPMIVEHLDAGR